MEPTQEQHDKSFLRGFAINDTIPLRNIMEALRYILTHASINSPVEELERLSAEENKIVQSIDSAIRTNPDQPLLLGATLRFVHSLSYSDNHIMYAAKELIILGEEPHLTSPESFPAEYSHAEASYRNRTGIDIYQTADRLRELAPGAFVPLPPSTEPPEKRNPQVTPHTNPIRSTKKPTYKEDTDKEDSNSDSDSMPPPPKPAKKRGGEADSRSSAQAPLGHDYCSNCRSYKVFANFRDKRGRPGVRLRSYIACQDRKKGEGAERRKSLNDE